MKKILYGISSCSRTILNLLLVSLMFFAGLSDLNAQDKNWLQIYGFAMTDVGYNANQIDPAWFDVVRPTKLPTMENQFGTDGNAYFSVRQSRFGTKSGVQTDLGELFVQLE
ncbi:MAG: hypothetical protein ACM34O_08535, partial [Ignavibacteria bacterium]